MCFIVFADAPVRQVKVTYEEYHNIYYMITHHIRKLEEESETAGGEDTNLTGSTTHRNVTCLI